MFDKKRIEDDSCYWLFMFPEFVNDNYVQKFISYYHYVYVNNKIKKKMSWKRVIKSFFYVVLKKTIVQNHEKISFLFFKSQNDREDYNKLFLAFYKNAPDPKREIQYHNIYTFPKVSKVVRLMRIIKFLKRNTFELDKETKGFLKKLYVCYQEAFFIAVQMECLSMFARAIPSLKCNCLVVLSDAQPYDAAMVLRGKYDAVKTITLQHALFSEAQKSCIELENYLLIPSDYALVWGEHTKRLFSKYNTGSKSIIVGNPIIKDEEEKTDNYIGLIFDSPMLKDENIRMAEIVSSYAVDRNMKLFIKIHPDDSVCNYKKYDAYIRDNINNALFYIGNNSTMMINLLVKNRPVFQFRSEMCTRKLDEDLRFNTEHELDVLVENIDKYDFLSMAKEYVSLKAKDAEQKIRETLEELNNN